MLATTRLGIRITIWLFLAAMLLAIAASAHAQGVGFNETAFKLAGTNIQIMPGAFVTVCTGDVTPTFTANPPCTPLALIYSNVLLTQAIQQPALADGLGNIQFFAAPAMYTVVITDTIRKNGYKIVWNAPAGITTSNTWTGVQTFNPGTLTLDITTNTLKETPATTGRYPRDNGTSFQPSAVAAAGVGGCTNQFPRTLNDNAAPTCAAVSLTADVSGILPIANGGNGTAATTGTGSAVFSTSPALATPTIGGGAALTRYNKISTTLTCTSIAASTFATQTFTVTGLQAADRVILSWDTAQSTNPILHSARASAINTLALDFRNPTASADTPTCGGVTLLLIQ